jgi:hypothetical protein
MKKKFLDDIHNVWSSLVTSNDYDKQILQKIGTLQNCFFEKWTENTEKPRKQQTDSERKKQLESLKKTITKTIDRLQVFLDTGVWRLRSEIHIQDEDSRLHSLMLSLNKQWLGIKSKADGLIDSKEIEKFTELTKFKTLKNQAVDKIQAELKFREIRREKRKFTFLIDV